MKNLKREFIMSNFVKDFKEFALKGNVMDMAIGVIIGGAFGKIVASLVDDIIMPFVGWLVGGIDLSALKVVVPAAIEGTEPATINYGLFIQTCIDFLIIALSIFLAIKMIAKMSRKHKEEEAAAAPAEPSATEKLLAEIRDELKKK